MTSAARRLWLLPVVALCLGPGPCGGDDPEGDDDDATASPALRIVADEPLVTSESGLQDSFTLRLGSSPGDRLVVVDVLNPDASEWAVNSADGEPVPATVRTADTLAWEEDIVLRYPHTDDGITGNQGLHNQGYHFDGSWHYCSGAARGSTWRSSSVATCRPSRSSTPRACPAGRSWSGRWAR